MTTSNNPEELRTEIEQTRANLSQNVNALGEAVTPGAIARRQVEQRDAGQTSGAVHETLAREHVVPARSHAVPPHQ